jgi:uncharacterized LabA/DUF88 family protein
MFNIYVDGESHFVRSENCWRKIHGEKSFLEDIEYIDPGRRCSNIFWGPTLTVNSEAIFFWDSSFAGLHKTQRHYVIGRAIYFTACTGDDNAGHRLRVFIRKQDFEPQVIIELKKLADQRANLLKGEGVIDKAKGVDIGLAVRLLEDAYADTFDGCLLFTSDVDFMPAIRVVRRIGKDVHVCGYRDGLSQNSPLEHEPDSFVDLEEIMRTFYRPKSKT